MPNVSPTMSALKQQSAYTAAYCARRRGSVANANVTPKATSVTAIHQPPPIIAHATVTIVAST